MEEKQVTLYVHVYTTRFGDWDCKPIPFTQDDSWGDDSIIYRRCGYINMNGLYAFQVSSGFIPKSLLNQVLTLDLINPTGGVPNMVYSMYTFGEPKEQTFKERVRALIGMAHAEVKASSAALLEAWAKAEEMSCREEDEEGDPQGENFN
jgi:hypothetical protein